MRYLAFISVFLWYASVQAFTNITHFQTWNGLTNGVTLGESAVSAGAFGPGTWTANGNPYSVMKGATNWPYRFPNWFQVGGTNIVQAGTNWVSWAPQNTTGLEMASYQAVGGSATTFTNGWIQGFMRVDMTNGSGINENFDFIEIDGNPWCIMQLGTGPGEGPWNMTLKAHAASGNGAKFDIERNKIYYYSLFRDPATAACQCDLYDPTNNFAAVTNQNGTYGSSGTMDGTSVPSWWFRIQGEYAAANPVKNVGTNWFSSVVIGLGPTASPTYPPGPDTNVIVSDYTYPFRADSTVGVRGGIPGRSGTVRDVTQAPYGVDKGGVTNASTGIQAAITASSSNDVVYLPAGRYNCATNALNLDVDGIEIRGELTNGVPATLVIGGVTMGHSSSGDQFITLTNGGWQGSSNLVLSATNTSDGNLTVGDFLEVSDLFSATNIATIDKPVVKYNNTGGPFRSTTQLVSVKSFNGFTVNISAPLVYYFTNTTAKVKTKNVPSLRPRLMSGLRDIRFTGTNGGLWTTRVALINATSTRDFYFTNCVFEYLNNYGIDFQTSAHFEIQHCLFQHALSIGTSRSGVSLFVVANGLLANNVFNDLSIGWQVQNGPMAAMATAYNFFTNISDKPFTLHSSHNWFILHEGNVNPGNTIVGDGYFGSSSQSYLFRNRFDDGTIGNKRFSSLNQFVRNWLGPRDSSARGYIAPRTSSYSGSYLFEDDFPHLSNNSFDGSAPPISPFWPGVYNIISGIITNVPYDILITTTTNVLGTNLFDTSVAFQRWTTNYQASGGGGNYPIVFMDASDTNRYWLDDLTTPVSATAVGPTNITLNQTITVSNGWKMFMAGAGGYNQIQSNSWTHIRHANTVYTNSSSLAVTVLDPIVLPLNFPDSILYTAKPGWWGTNQYPVDGSAPIPAQTWFAGDGISGNVPDNQPRVGKLKAIRMRTK